MAFGQLIEYNMRNIFLEKSYKKTIHNLFLSCRGFAFTSYKAFLKNKKRSGTSLPATLSAWLLKKYISLVILYYFLEPFSKKLPNQTNLSLKT